MLFKQNLYLHYFYLHYKFFLKKLLKIISYMAFNTALITIYKPWYRYFFFRNTNFFYNYLYLLQLKVKKLFLKISNNLYTLFYVSNNTSIIIPNKDNYYFRSNEYIYFKKKKNTLLIFFQFLMYVLYLGFIPNTNIRFYNIKLYLKSYLILLPTLHMFYYKKKLL